MATQPRYTESTRPDEDEDEDEDKKLEEEVKELAKKVKELRSTFPTHLKSSLSPLLLSLRPSLSISSDVSLPGPSSRPHLLPGANSSENLNGEVAAEGGERMADDIKLLNDKISTNLSSMPKVLKRMNDCLSRIDSLVSSNETTHPVFKRKRH